jgi:hypothetical protein
MNDYQLTLFTLTSMSLIGCNYVIRVLLSSLGTFHNYLLLCRYLLYFNFHLFSVFLNFLTEINYVFKIIKLFILTGDYDVLFRRS